ADKEVTVDSLVHFLARQGAASAPREFSTRAQIARGQQLYHTVGCVACHPAFAPAAPQKKELVPGEDEKPAVVEAVATSVAFGDLALKTPVDALAKFLADPLHVRPSGRMPSLYLNPSEAREIAAYLLRDQYTQDVTSAMPGLEAAVYAGKWE